MNQFAKVMKEEENRTYTENGATAIKSTGDSCLNLFAVIGALRHGGNIDSDRAQTLFAESYKEDPLLATKILFYARDIRGGLGEREVIRQLMRYTAEYHPEALRNNLDLVGVYGRYDDLYSLIGTQLENDMWKAMSRQFEEDKKNLTDGNAISLLAKWIKTPDASSRKTRKLGILTAQMLGYSVYDFKRILRRMRKQIDIVERYMSAGEWNKIKYSNVSSRAMMIYRKAFEKHDGSRYSEFINKALTGEEKINSATLYPYDIVEKIMNKIYSISTQDEKVLEAQWRQLPDYVGDDNILIMADVSGSMTGRPMASSVGLALYFAERNKGDFHNLFMTFSGDPEFVSVKGETLRQKISNAMNARWSMNTNLEAAFKKVLDMAVRNNIPASEMPKAIVVISDMEIDQATRSYDRYGYRYDDNECEDWLFYDQVKHRFNKAGYEIPNVIFWNVDSRNDVFHSDSRREGVQLVSGHSTNTFKTLVKCMNMTPYEAMLEVLNSDRYSAITIADEESSKLSA